MLTFITLLLTQLCLEVSQKFCNYEILINVSSQVLISLVHLCLLAQMLKSVLSMVAHILQKKIRSLVGTRRKWRARKFTSIY